MFSWIENRFALSRKGAKDFCQGVLFTAILDVALMLSAVYVYLFFSDYLPTILNPSVAVLRSPGFYLITGISFMVILFLIAVLQYRSTYTVIYEESASRRIHLAEKLRKLPLAFFGEKNLTDLTSTIMEDCTELEHTFSHAVPQLFASLISLTIIAIGLFFYQWQLALALFWVVPISGLAIMISKKMQRQGFEKVLKVKLAMSEAIQEGIETIQEIKAYHQESSYLEDLRKKADAFEQNLVRVEIITGGLLKSAESFLKLGLASVIIVGANLLAIGQVDFFVYLMFLIVASRIYNPISEVFNNMAALFYLDVRIQRTKDIDLLPVQSGRTQFQPDGYTITFDHVGFSYEEGKQVLHDLSFTANQGEITALVGPSGGGKSTTAKLSARFWDADTGKIFLGSQDIGAISPETLLESFAVVFQDVVLFNSTVMDNIRIGKRDATDEEVVHAAKIAQCDNFVRKLPNGYQTVLGENGETLSGGERQRISIARALLKDAPIILLDEATASLDVENETKIQSALSELVREKTVLIIAHRMRTIANADKIVVLEQGRIREMGSPEELKEENGWFAQMLYRQSEASST